MKFKKYKAEHDYISNSDLLHKLGYREYKPKLGGLGKAILEACNKSEDYRSISWIKKQLNSYFKRLRQEREDRRNGLQKQNSRPSL